VNLTQDNPQQYVIDTNTLIDLHCGQLFPFIFQLPCVFIVSDFIVYELRYLPFQTLLTMGLVVESLSSEGIVEISSMMGRYEKPSYADLSVLVLARSKNTILITGDEPLRYAAVENGVNCFGTCWLIDFLADQKIISYAQAIAAYQLIQKNKRFPPRDECKTLLSKWKQRRKLLE
jgi:rRNA-processing protein FCF1